MCGGRWQRWLCVFGFINLPELLVRLYLLLLLYSYLLLLYRLYQPSRTLGQADHDNIALVLIMMMVIVMAIKEANTKKEEELRQVNQQKHMVANKFDPRMDPVVVQVLVVDVQVLVVQAQQ